MGSPINFDPVRNINPPGLGGSSTPLQQPPVGPSGADVAAFGASGVSAGQSMNIVIERAMEQLRAVVGEARAELGIPEGAVIDTSPEATANRIADFALGAFESYWKNHDDLNQDDARAAFADFIGKAINQGIEEARDILTALNALNPEVGGNIDTISSIIQERLEAFVTGG